MHMVTGISVKAYERRNTAQLGNYVGEVYHRLRSQNSDMHRGQTLMTTCSANERRRRSLNSKLGSRIVPRFHDVRAINKLWPWIHSKGSAWYAATKLVLIVNKYWYMYGIWLIHKYSRKSGGGDYLITRILKIDIFFCIYVIFLIGKFWSRLTQNDAANETELEVSP